MPHSWLSASAIFIACLAVFWSSAPTAPVLCEWFIETVLTWPRDTSIQGNNNGELPLLTTAEQLAAAFKAGDGGDLRVLVVGGTRGVGYGTALWLTRAGVATHVVLVGRNETVGTHAVTTLQQEQQQVPYSDNKNTNPPDQEQKSTTKIEYLQGDLGDIQSTQTLVTNLERWTQTHGRFDVLVVSAGIFPDWNESQNENGLEKSFAIAVVGRYLLYRDMHRFMKTTSSSWENAFKDNLEKWLDDTTTQKENIHNNPPTKRVLNILASGMNIPYTLHRDMALGKQMPKSLLGALINFNTAHELMLRALETHHYSTTVQDSIFVSTHPGIIATELHRGQGMVSQALMHAGEAMFGISVETAGLVQASILASQYLPTNRISYVDMFRIPRRLSPWVPVQQHLDWLWTHLLEPLSPRFVVAVPSSSEKLVV